MMSREEKVMVAVKKAESQGYKFLGKGIGKYDEALASNRQAGYDVRCWYTNMKGDALTWIMYGRVKGGVKRVAKTEDTQQAVFSNNPITNETYYHGFQSSAGYASMTVKDLKKICSEKKISGYSKMNKEQMIQSLKSAC